MNEKILEMANADLADLTSSLCKIRAAAMSTNSYVEASRFDPSDSTLNVFYMLDVIIDISNLADEKISEIAKKLVAISQEMR